MLLVLIARIHLQLNQVDDGRKAFLEAQQKASRFEDKKRMESDGDKLNPGGLAQLASDTRKIEMALDEVKGIIDDILQAKEDEDLLKAKAMVQGLEGRKKSEIRKILEQHRFSVKVIDKVAPEKKGLFGRFR